MAVRGNRVENIELISISKLQKIFRLAEDLEFPEVQKVKESTCKDSRNLLGVLKIPSMEVASILKFHKFGN